MPSEQPPRRSGNARLAAAVIAMSPALVATYAQAAIVRSRFANVAAVKRAFALLDRRELVDLVESVHLLGAGKSNAVVAVTLHKGRRCVIKRALPFGTLMAWGARHFGANFVYADDTTATARIDREMTALDFLAARGIAVPALIAGSPRHELLALDWIDGEPAATALHGPEADHWAREIGKLLRQVHAAGVTLADGHPGNMMIENETRRLVLFDLEFAEVSGSTAARRGFDLAYAAVLMPSEPLRIVMLEAYGALTADEDAALTVAETHLHRFGKLLDMERARWTPPSAG